MSEGENSLAAARRAAYSPPPLSGGNQSASTAAIKDHALDGSQRDLGFAALPLRSFWYCPLVSSITFRV